MPTNRKALFLFGRCIQELGIETAVIKHWIRLPPGTLEVLNFEEWILIFYTAPFQHPAKQESLKRIKKMADSFPQRKDYYGCLGALNASRAVYESKKL